MPKYTYTISNQNGVKSSGSLYAANPQAAKDQIKMEEGQILIALNEDKVKTEYFWQRPKLKFQEKLMFTKHLATMLRVGITISDALQVFIQQTKNTNNKKMFQRIYDMIQSGQSLSKSLQEYEHVFSQVYINMIATGEESGTLEQVLEYLDIQLEKEYEVRKKVIGAFIYPAVLIGITILLMIGIVVFIMPKIIDIFESFEVKLPFATRVFIGFSKLLTETPLLALGGFVGIIAFSFFIFRFKYFRKFWQSFMIKIPLFGKIIIYSNLARFARTLNSLLQSGVPITRSLDITGNMLTNKQYRNKILEAKARIEKGGKLGESLADDEKLFPTLSVRMIEVGEKTGSLEITTQKLAELYEKNVESLTKNLSTFLEPFLLIFMAGLVGGLAMAIILPIYQLPNLLQG